MNILIYILAGIAALEIAGVLALFILWRICRIIANAQLKRLAKAAALTGQPEQPQPPSNP